MSVMKGMCAMLVRLALMIISLCIYLCPVSAAAFGEDNSIRDGASRYALFFVSTAQAPLAQIFNAIQAFYTQNALCPNNDAFALDVTSTPSLALATNNGCVAVVTFSSQFVSPLVQNKQIAVGPRWVTSNNTWSFDNTPLIATNINDQPNSLAPTKDCSTLQLFSQDSSFIGAFYASNPVAMLQNKTNTCSIASKAAV